MPGQKKMARNFFSFLFHFRNFEITFQRHAIFVVSDKNTRYCVAPASSPEGESASRGLGVI
jgi:hypothetical protein